MLANAPSSGVLHDWSDVAGTDSLRQDPEKLPYDLENEGGSQLNSGFSPFTRCASAGKRSLFNLAPKLEISELET